MKLASRVSAFFLLAMALVLAGFSIALYASANAYLAWRDEEKMQRALDVLEASVDIEPGGLEWEPVDRRMTLGVDHSVDAVRWVVRDEKGGFVDRSTNCPPDGFPSDWSPKAWPRNPSDDTVLGDAPGWRLAARRLELNDLLKQGRGHPDDEPGFEKQYAHLVLVVGLSPVPAESALARLALTLGAFSLGIWAVAAAAGRWLCDRALDPLHQMAKAATAMSASDRGVRLPVAGTGDELDDLGVAFNELLDRLHDAFARMDEAYQRQSRFASDASHQLRTPLAAMLGQVQFALRRDRSSEDYRRVLDVVRTEGERLRQVVETLLALARPDGEAPPAEELDLSEWAAEQIPRWASHPRAADLTLDASQTGDALVEGRPRILSQILDNLLENAFKYSDPGSPVVVEVRRTGHEVVLGVRDRGLGLTPEEAAEAFKPFFRAERIQLAGHPGLGLGLAIAARLASATGAVLDVVSEAGRGSLFRLRMPATVGRPPPETTIERA